MENKNVKVIDENNIDRVANVICSFIADQVKYVLYSISRDDESDNLFVSKLVDNNDKTSNMVNIEDTMEKAKVNEIVRDLVTYSLRNESDKADKIIELPGNIKVEIVDVMFNKEQNINVSKTYVSTVKKSVAKVSNDFYKIDFGKNADLDATNVFEPLSTDELKKIEISMPEIGTDDTKGVLEDKKEEEIIEQGAELELPKQLLDSAPAVAEVKEPEINFIPLTNKPGDDKPMMSAVAEAKEPEINFIPLTNKPGDDKPMMSAVAEAKEPEINFIPLTNKPGDDKPMEVVQLNPESVNPSGEQKLFFDGSSESNLNKALDEVSDEKVMMTPQDGVASLREFGMDKPASVQSQESNNLETEKAKTLTRSKGFANNKFFMVVAIAFFIAACIFLGYEAFQYFQLRG